MRVVVCDRPAIGGTTRFCSNLVAAFEGTEHDIIRVAIGAQACQFSDEDARRFGHFEKVAADVEDSTEAGRVFIEWVIEREVDVVLPHNSIIASYASQYLPSQIAVVPRCNSITRHTYRQVVVPAAWSNAIICVAPRQIEDLSSSYGLLRERLRLIPNCADVRTRVREPDGDALRLGYIGRLHHESKGVMFLPDIVAELEKRSVFWTLTIAGSGPEEGELRSRLAAPIADGRVVLRDAVGGSDVGALMDEIDVFLLTSRFEGSPNGLLEAMGTGCVPVATRLKGVTDAMLTEGERGVLCGMGDAVAYADAIASLAADPDRLASMSAAARERVRSAYSLDVFRQAMEALFTDVVGGEEGLSRKTDLTSMRVGEFEPWYSWVPGPVKTFLRDFLERMRSR